jgi:rhomboid protease GluP
MSGPREGGSLADVVLQTPLTWLISALNLGVFLVSWIRGPEGMDVETDVLLKMGASMRYYVQGGEYWRLLTAVFLHGSWLHVGVNTICMFSWCAAIERAVGSRWFAFAYLTTGIGSYAVSVLSSPVPSVGASGAGFGMIAVTLAILYRREGSWAHFIGNPFVRQTINWAVAWILAGIFLIQGLDNSAHVGGLVFGVFCGLILERRRGRHEVRWMAALAAYLLVWAGVIVAACTPGMGFRLGG